MSKSANILIVDDNERNRNVLKYSILELGHNPVLEENGSSALARMENQQPDIVLLDLLMPEMDGYEVLKCMKESKVLCQIPVIMITAVDEVESVAKCIESGADDYFTKPFNQTLLKARINNCLVKKKLHDKEKYYRLQLEKINLSLKDTVHYQTEELSEAFTKLRVLDKAREGFIELISNELNAPLQNLFGTAEIAFAESTNPQTRTEFKELFKISRDRLINIIHHALLLTELKLLSGKIPLETFSVKKALDKAVDFTSPFAALRQVKLEKKPDCDAQALCNDELLSEAFSAILQIAVKYSSKDNEVSISCEVRDNDICVGISAHGRTIPEEMIPVFFEPFSISSTVVPGGDLGLAPPLAESIINLFKGSIMVKNLVPAGILFSIILKKKI